MPVSKTQIDRLGDRLKEGSHTESDLRLLDDYRRSFGESYEVVVGTIRQRGQFPTGRLAKSTLSIVEKLRRESLRLSQMQDIAGCRVVVGGVLEQDQFVASLIADFPGASVMDRRDNPSHDYRAVHVIVEISGKPVEIQVRTALQHLWAEVSEKSSDVLDPTIKYGGGTDLWRNFLTKSSESVAAYENLEKAQMAALEVWTKGQTAALEKWTKAVAELQATFIIEHAATEQDKERWQAEAGEYKEQKQAEAREFIEGKKLELARKWKEIADHLTGAISQLDKIKEQTQ